MQIHRRQHTILDLSVTRFREHVDPRVRNTMALRIQFKKTHRRFLRFDDGGTILETVTEGPVDEKLEAFRLDAFLSSDLSSKAIGSMLYGSFSGGDWKELYFERLISYLAHEHAKAAVAAEVDTLALKAEFEVMIDTVEPCERCMACLVEFRPREVMERKPCGHTYHEDCIEYYIKRNIDCPTCYYDDSEALNGGAREFAHEEDIIKISSGFPFINDDGDDDDDDDD